MAVFLVTFDHPDEAAWQQWVRPHVDWIRQQVDDGAVVASGPSVGTPVRQGLLVMRADDETALRKIIRTDPFWPNGVIENLRITEWDPFFGAFSELSSNPDGPSL